MQKRKSQNLISLGVFFAVVALVVAVAAINKQDQQRAGSAQIVSRADPTSGTAKAAAVNTTNQATASSFTYTAGSYTAEGSYQTPENQAAIKVTLTVLADGTITDSNVIGESSGGNSREYQQLFINGYKSKVVGQKISTLRLGNVSGSSLTPIGFNNALAVIRREAANS